MPCNKNRAEWIDFIISFVVCVFSAFFVVVVKKKPRQQKHEASVICANLTTIYLHPTSLYRAITKERDLLMNEVGNLS